MQAYSKNQDAGTHTIKNYLCIDFDSLQLNSFSAVSRTNSCLEILSCFAGQDIVKHSCDPVVNKMVRSLSY